MSKAHVMKDGFYKVTNGLQPITKVKDHVMYSKDYRFDTDMTIDIEYGKVYLYRINQLEKLECAKASYLRLLLVTFPYFPSLFLPFVIFPYLPYVIIVAEIKINVKGMKCWAYAVAHRQLTIYIFENNNCIIFKVWTIGAPYCGC